MAFHPFGVLKQLFAGAKGGDFLDPYFVADSDAGNSGAITNRIFQPRHCLA